MTVACEAQGRRQRATQGPRDFSLIASLLFLPTLSSRNNSQGGTGGAARAPDTSELPEACNRSAHRFPPFHRSHTQHGDSPGNRR